MTKTATFIRKLDRDDLLIDARLYRLSEPMTLHSWLAPEDVDEAEPSSDYVVVSGSNMPALRYPETYIFLADETGEITNWLECPGSFQGNIDHTLALKNAGYDLVGD